MARSTVIYLVTANDKPVAAFTVKWEMESWIRSHPGDYKKFRMSDGLYGLESVGKLPAEMVEK